MQNQEDPLHPGEVLNKKFIIPESISLDEVSDITGMSVNHIQGIIDKKRMILNETAKKLSKFRKDFDYWKNLQAEYDAFNARKKLKGILPDESLLESVMINDPHDKLIKIVLSDRNEAIEFFKYNLPPEIANKIQWDTLELEGTKYIDDEMQGSESDILFSANFKDSDEKCFLYFLFEHQSKPEKWMRFRLYKYKGRIWDDLFNDSEKKPESLPPILSMVFYIGKNKWNYSTDFFDLIYKNPLNPKYIPGFDHVLWDFSTEPEEIKAAIKLKLSIILMRAHFQGSLLDASQIILEYLNEIPDNPGINHKKVFWYYIARTQHQKAKALKKYIDENPTKVGGNMITIIDEWRQEGEIKGEIKTIERMLNVGIEWQTIYKATGIDSKKFEEMKMKLQSYAPIPMLAEQTMPKDFSYSRANA